MTFNNLNSNIIQSAYTRGPGNSSSDPFVTYFSTVDPTVNDVNFPIQKRWVNFALIKEWILKSYINTSGTTRANWVLINSGAALTLMIPVPFGTSPVTPDGTGSLSFTSGDSSVTITGGANTIDFRTTTSGLTSITGDDGVAVTPTAGNIGLQGLVVSNGTHAKAVYTESPVGSVEKIDVQVAATAASTNIAKVGLAAFSSAQFSVDGNGFVTFVGGVTPPTLGLVPDAHTAPGTTPVIPNGSGNINVTGSSVAAGTTPVRSDSLAANTITIEVQKSQAIASTDATKVGLSAYSSADFNVDSNGFVTLASGTIGQTITGNSGGALSPTGGNWNILGTGSFTTIGSGSTLTLELTGLTNHAVLVGAGTATITNVGPNAASGIPLISQGLSADPAFGTAVVAGGGTGATSFSAYAPICGGTTSTNPLQSATTGFSTSGFVLTSNGSSALPSFQAPSTGALVKLAASSASSSASISFNSTYITNTYNTYIVNIQGMTLSDTAPDFYMDWSIDNGSTYLSSNYLTGIQYINWNSTVWGNGNKTITCYLGHLASAYTYNVTLYIYGLGASGIPSYTGNVITAGTNIFAQGGQTATVDVNNIKFSPTAGTILTGTFTLYGLVP